MVPVQAGLSQRHRLEKLGQIGGLCNSLTVDGLSYDLGANYVTWAYEETLAIANEVGATTYAEKPYTSIDIAPDRTSFKYRHLTGYPTL